MLFGIVFGAANAYLGLRAGLTISTSIPSLPFAVGVYLPVSTMTPLFVGGLLRGLFERRAPSKARRADVRERGVLLGSGFVGGEGLLGVGIAAVAFVQGARPGGFGTGWLGPAAELAGLVAFGVFIAGFARLARR